MCLVCKQREFSLGIPNINWSVQQEMQVNTKKCDGLGATSPFEVACSRLPDTGGEDVKVKVHGA